MPTHTHRNTETLTHTSTHTQTLTLPCNGVGALLSATFADCTYGVCGVFHGLSALYAPGWLTWPPDSSPHSDQTTAGRHLVTPRWPIPQSRGVHCHPILPLGSRGVTRLVLVADPCPGDILNGRNPGPSSWGS